MVFCQWWSSKDSRKNSKKKQSIAPRPLCTVQWPAQAESMLPLASLFLLCSGSIPMGANKCFPAATHRRRPPGMWNSSVTAMAHCRATSNGFAMLDTSAEMMSILSSTDWYASRSAVPDGGGGWPRICGAQAPGVQMQTGPPRVKPCLCPGWGFDLNDETSRPILINLCVTHVNDMEAVE